MLAILVWDLETRKMERQFLLIVVIRLHLCFMQFDEKKQNVGQIGAAIIFCYPCSAASIFFIL